MDRETKKKAKRTKDAKVKKWKRRQVHLQKQVDKNRARIGAKIQVWSGPVEDGKWIQATQLSNFCDVREMGMGKKKGPVISDAAIVKFDGELGMEIVEKKMCREEKSCMASQGRHSGAKLYHAIRLITIDDLVLVKWPDCGTEEWLPASQVKPPPAPSRSRTNPRNFVDINAIMGTMMGTNDGMASTGLPFSNTEDFLSAVETSEKNRTQKDTEEMQKKAPKRCKKCQKNQARRRGGLCNSCFKHQR